MESIDKLREYVKEAPPTSMGNTSRAIVAGFADEIEREVEGMREFCERLNDAAEARDDVTLWGVDYMTCPLDADGEPIHVGDMMEWPDGKAFEVEGIGKGVLFYTDGDGNTEWVLAGTKRHHHTPTVEDVLREFADRVCSGDHIVVDGAYRGLEDSGLLAEYAAKLRLAGDAE